MLRRIIKLLLTCLIFYLYFKILGFIFNSFVPFTPTTDFIALVLIILLFPLSILTVYGMARVLQKNKLAPIQTLPFLRKRDERDA